ncbi:hypothetical protein EJB05_53028, partial [Eragrostis curvula]
MDTCLSPVQPPGSRSIQLHPHSPSGRFSLLQVFLKCPAPPIRSLAGTADPLPGSHAPRNGTSVNGTSSSRCSARFPGSQSSSLFQHPTYLSPTAAALGRGALQLAHSPAGLHLFNFGHCWRRRPDRRGHAPLLQRKFVLTECGELTISIISRSHFHRPSTCMAFQCSSEGFNARYRSKGSIYIKLLFDHTEKNQSPGRNAGLKKAINKSRDAGTILAKESESRQECRIERTDEARAWDDDSLRWKAMAELWAETTILYSPALLCVLRGTSPARIMIT